MNRKGLIAEVPSLFVIGTALVFFTLLFALMGIALSPTKGSIKDSDSLASVSRVADFLEMNGKFNEEKTTTLGLIDEYCATNDADVQKKQADEITRRSHLMFNNLFASLQFSCHNGMTIHLRDYLCNEPKVFPIINPDGTTNTLYFCDNPERIVTTDGKEWERERIGITLTTDRLVEVKKGATQPIKNPTRGVTLTKFRRDYALSS